MRCREKDRHRGRLVLFLVQVGRRPEVPTEVSPDLLVLLEDLGHLYCVADRWCRVCEVLFESGIRECQKIFR